MDTFGIAVLGAGLIGQTHLQAIAGTRGFRLAGIVDPSDAAAAVAARHGGRRFPDLDGLLAAGGVDGVVIATPNETHVALATRLLDAGVPVLIEKPIANTVAEAKQILAAEARSGARALVGHHRRHNPIVAAAKEAIADGMIGDLVMASVICSLMKPEGYFATRWRTTPGVGGPLLINMIHEIDLLRHFFGDVAAVSAMQSNAVRGLEVEDTGAAVLRFAARGLATVAVSDTAAGPWAWDLASGENPRFGRSREQSHFFAGTEGGLTLPDLAHWTHAGAKDWAVPLRRTLLGYTAEDSYVRQLRHFGEVIAGAAEPLVSALDGAKDVATLAAIRGAAASGRETAVERLDGPDPASGS